MPNAKLQDVVYTGMTACVMVFGMIVEIGYICFENLFIGFVIHKIYKFYCNYGVYMILYKKYISCICKSKGLVFFCSCNCKRSGMNKIEFRLDSNTGEFISYLANRQIFQFSNKASVGANSECIE